MAKIRIKEREWRDNKAKKLRGVKGEEEECEKERKWGTKAEIVKKKKVVRQTQGKEWMKERRKGITAYGGSQASKQPIRCMIEGIVTALLLTFRSPYYTVNHPRSIKFHNIISTLWDCDVYNVNSIGSQEKTDQQPINQISISLFAVIEIHGSRLSY